MRVADYVIDFIAQQNVGAVFLVPGGGSMHLCDALALNERVEYIPTHHEQAAAIAAEAHARVTGNLGCVLVTTGPGGTNTITAVAGSWIESIPLLVVSGQVKTPDLLRDSGLRQKGVQEVDIVSIVKPITKYAKLISNPQHIRYELEKACFLATSGRKGPVWLDIPLDVQSAQVDPESLVGFDRPTQVMSIKPNIFSDFYQLIDQAARPVLIAGHGVRIADAADEFREFYEALGIPVLTTWNAMDLIPSSHSLSAGKPGVVALRAPNFVVQNSDLVIVVGARLDNLVTAYNLENFGRNAKLVVIDVDPAEIRKFEGLSKTALTVQVDAKVFLREILKAGRLPPRSNRSEWIRFVQGVKNRYPVNDGLQFAKSGLISSFHFTDALSRAVPDNCLICTGSSGLCIEAFYTGFSTKPGQRIFLNTGLGAMGYGLPTIVGAGIASGGEEFVAVESDGSFMMNLQELQTIKTLKLPVRLFVMNNSGYGSIRNTQRNYFNGRLIGTGPESKLGFPNFSAIGAAMGWETMEIPDASCLEDRIDEALSRRGPLLIDVAISPNETLWPKSASIIRSDGSMISMPLEDMSPLLSMEELRSNMLVEIDRASQAVRGD